MPVAEPKKSSRKAVVETAIVEEEIEDEEEYEEEDTREVIVRRRDIQGVSKQLKKRKRPVFDSYCPPDFDILTPGEGSSGMDDDQLLIQMSELIEEKLSDFNILGKVTEVHPGPVITMFEFEPAAGVKVGKIASLQDDLAMSLKASAIRIIAPIPNKGTVGIEVPNIHRDIVRLREVFESPDFLQEEKDLSIALGKDIYGEPVVVDVASMPHLLLAGATGAGKSVCINTILLSLLFRSSPEDLGLILIDPKILELSVYDGIPHLRAPVVTVPKQAKAVLEWAVKEMNSRYRMMQKHGVRNIDGYNRMVRGLDEHQASPKKKIPGVINLQAEQVIALGNTDLDLNDTGEDLAEVSISEELQTLPKIVIVIDEMADLMLSVGRDIEDLVARLAQKARAAGIHMILATQRPSVDVITGLIKANFPARISFRVTSRIDSRTILDSMGAERLLGKGDMLMMMPGAHHLKRVHGAFVSDQEVNNVIAKLKEGSKPQYDEEILDYCARRFAPLRLKRELAQMHQHIKVDLVVAGNNGHKPK
jgi:DNA segregation ATPase FtsK/SpoIIIE, S-DNA-T family